MGLVTALHQAQMPAARGGLSSRLYCGLGFELVTPSVQAGPGHGPRRHRDDDSDNDDEEEDGPVPGDDQYADGEGDPCPNCGRVYRCAFCPVLCGHLRILYQGARQV